MNKEQEANLVSSLENAEQAQAIEPEITQNESLTQDSLLEKAKQAQAIEPEITQNESLTQDSPLEKAKQAQAIEPEITQNESLTQDSSKNTDAVKLEFEEDVNTRWKLSLSPKNFVSYLVLLALLFILILPFLGSVWSSYSWSKRPELPYPENISINQNIPVEVNVGSKDRALDEKVNRRTLTVLAEARATAEDFASRDLDAWLDELKTRVDGDFFDWYYSYFNQKGRETLALWRGVTGQNISEKEFQDFNQQFTSRVVSPEDIKVRLEVLTAEVTNLYALELNKKLTAAQKDLQIPLQQWNLYLARIAETVAKRDPISGSALAGTSITGGYLLADALLSGTVSAFFEGQAVRILEPVITTLGPEAASAFGFGAMGAVKIAGKFAGPILGGGLIAYDLLNYSHKVDQEKPKLRERIFSNLQLLKRSSLADVTTRINQLESNIRKSIDSVSITNLE